eukprot:8373472-Pyramimonas_sp.AAC.1
MRGRSKAAAAHSASCTNLSAAPGQVQRAGEHRLLALGGPRHYHDGSLITGHTSHLRAAPGEVQRAGEHNLQALGGPRHWARARSEGALLAGQLALMLLLPRLFVTNWGRIEFFSGKTA